MGAHSLDRKKTTKESRTLESYIATGGRTLSDRSAPEKTD